MTTDKKDLVPLPTIEVTVAQEKRMLSAFQNKSAYQKWLKNTLVDYVLSVETNKKRQADEQAYSENLIQGRIELGYIPD